MHQLQQQSLPVDLGAVWCCSRSAAEPHTSADPACLSCSPVCHHSTTTTTAALLRQVYIRQGLGVGQLRMKYGGRNVRRGVRPEHFAKCSGGLIRHILKQFESLGFVEKHTGAS